MTAESVHIRRAGAEDAELLADLVSRAFQTVALRFRLTPANCPKHPSNRTETWIRRDMDKGVVDSSREKPGAFRTCRSRRRSWLCH